MADYSDPEDDFVRNVEEESLEYDVERQIDQTIAAYNQKKDNEFRPQSSTKGNIAPKVRIESAKPAGVTRKEPTRPVESAQFEGQKRGQYQTKKEMFYERFDDYVRQNHISPDDFWNPTKEKMNADEFKECLDIIGFPYQKDEFEDVIFDITDGNFDVVLPSLCAKVTAWENYTADKTLEAIKDNVLKMAQESKKKLNSAGSSKKGFMIRPQSGTLYSPNSGAALQNARPFSGISVISSKSKKGLLGSANSEYDKTELISTMKKSHYENKSAQYLKDAKKKQAKQDQVLSLTLNKAKGEQEYDCLAKMGEANELSQALGETITYRAYKAADGSLRCHIYDYDQLVAELTPKEFIREYKLLKQKYNQKNNLKIWEVLNQQKTTGANFYFSSAKTAGGKPGDEDYENERKAVAKKDRQKELKTVLYETMKLTVTLKSQLDKLEKSGLVYDLQPPKY